MELPNGTVISPLAPVLPFARAILRPIVEGGADYAENGDVFRAIEAMAGESIHAGRDFLMGKASVPLRAVDDLIVRNADFLGRPIATEEGYTGWGQRAAYLAQQNIPIFAQPLVAAASDRFNLPLREREAGIPGAEPTIAGRLQEAIPGYVGLTVRPGARLPAEAGAAFRAALGERGVEPGNDKDLLRQWYSLKLDPSEKAAMLRAHPEIREFFEAKTRKEGERYERPAGQQLVREYQAKAGRLDIDKRNALIALERENLPGDEYRRRRAIIMQRSGDMKKGLQEAIFDTSDPDRIDRALAAVYAKDGAQSAERKALDGLYAIRPESDSLEDRDRYFRERDAYLESLSPALRERLLQRELDNAPTQLERAYLVAQRAYQDYMKISPYLGLDAEEARIGSRVLDQARDYARYTGLPQNAAVMLLPAPAKAKLAALRLRAAPINPARRLFLERRPELSRFYSGLPSETADAIVRARSA